MGSIASQGVLIAGGAQDKFDWKQVGIAAIGGAVTGGITGATPIKGMASGLGRAMVTGGVNSAVTGGVASVLDVASFDWKNVGIAAVAAGAGYGMGQMMTSGGFRELGAKRSFHVFPASGRLFRSSEEWGSGSSTN